MNGQVGEAAGKVWHALTDGGPQTLPQLKKKVNEPNEVLLLAVGWLAREDKVQIIQEKKSLRVQLKQQEV